MASHYDLHALLCEYVHRNYFGKTLNLILSRINSVEHALGQKISSWYGTDPNTGTFYGPPATAKFPHMRITYEGAPAWIDLRTRIDELRAIGGAPAFPWVFTPSYSDYTNGTWRACIDIRQMLELLQAIGRITSSKVGFRLHKKLRFWCMQDEVNGKFLERWQTSNEYDQQVYVNIPTQINSVFELDAIAYIYASNRRIKLINWGDGYFYPETKFHFQNTGIHCVANEDESDTYLVSWYDGVDRIVHDMIRYGVENDMFWYEPDIPPKLFKGVGFYVDIYNKGDFDNDTSLDWIEKIGESLGILSQVDFDGGVTDIPPDVVTIDGYNGRFKYSTGTIIEKSTNRTPQDSFTVMGRVYHDTSTYEDPYSGYYTDEELITGDEHGVWHRSLHDYGVGVWSPKEEPAPHDQVIDEEKINDVIDVDEYNEKYFFDRLICKSSNVEPNSLDDLINADSSSDGDYFWFIPEGGVDAYYDWVGLMCESGNGHISTIIESYQNIDEKDLRERMGEPPDLSDIFSGVQVPRAGLGFHDGAHNIDIYGIGSGGSIDSFLKSEDGYHARKLAYISGLNQTYTDGYKWIFWNQCYIPIGYGWPNCLKPSEV